MTDPEQNHDEDARLRVAGFLWVQVAPGQWRTLMVRMCGCCGETEMSPVYRIDDDHAWCWHCMSQQLQFLSHASTPELQVWKCMNCHHHTSIQVSHE